MKLIGISVVDVVDLLIILVIKGGGSIGIVDSDSVPKISEDEEVLSGKSEYEESIGHTANGSPFNIGGNECKSLIKRLLPTIRRTIAKTTTACGKGT